MIMDIEVLDDDGLLSELLDNAILNERPKDSKSEASNICVDITSHSFIKEPIKQKINTIINVDESSIELDTFENEMAMIISDSDGQSKYESDEGSEETEDVPSVIDLVDAAADDFHMDDDIDAVKKNLVLASNGLSEINKIAQNMHPTFKNTDNITSYKMQQLRSAVENDLSAIRNANAASFKSQQLQLNIKNMAELIVLKDMDPIEFQRAFNIKLESLLHYMEQTKLSRRLLAKHSHLCTLEGKSTTVHSSKASKPSTSKISNGFTNQY